MSTCILHSRACESNGEDSCKSPASCKSQATDEESKVHVWMCLCVQLLMLLMFSFETGHFWTVTVNLIYDFVCCRKDPKGKPLSQIEKLEVMVRSACKCEWSSLCILKTMLPFCEEVADSSLEAAVGCGPWERQNGHIFGESCPVPGEDQDEWEVRFRKAGTWHVRFQYVSCAYPLDAGMKLGRIVPQRARWSSCLIMLFELFLWFQMSLLAYCLCWYYAVLCLEEGSSQEWQRQVSYPQWIASDMKSLKHALHLLKMSGCSIWYFIKST